MNLSIYQDNPDVKIFCDFSLKCFTIKCVGVLLAMAVVTREPTEVPMNISNLSNMLLFSCFSISDIQIAGISPLTPPPSIDSILYICWYH